MICKYHKSFWTAKSNAVLNLERMYYPMAKNYSKNFSFAQEPALSEETVLEWTQAPSVPALW